MFRMGDGEEEGDGTKAGAKERVSERARAGGEGDGTTPLTVHN